MEILKADKSYKKKCFAIYLMLVAMGGLLIIFGLPKFLHFVSSKPPEEAFSILVNILEALLLSVVPLGIYFCLLAWRILSAKQFPLPGQRVFKDTLILKGVKAKRRAYFLFGFGVILIAFAVISALTFPPMLSGTLKVLAA